MLWKERREFFVLVWIRSVIWQRKLHLSIYYCKLGRNCCLNRCLCQYQGNRMFRVEHYKSTVFGIKKFIQIYTPKYLPGHASWAKSLLKACHCIPTAVLTSYSFPTLTIPLGSPGRTEIPCINALGLGIFLAILDFDLCHKKLHEGSTLIFQKFARFLNFWDMWKTDNFQKQEFLRN